MRLSRRQIAVFSFACLLFGVSIPPPAHAATPTKCFGHLASIVGTSGDDYLRGTPGRDVILGLAGNDRIAASPGDDVICGNAGRDYLIGGPGEDKLSGGFGADALNDGRGDDVSFGGRGRDDLTSYVGRSLYPLPLVDRWDDIVRGGPGEDVIEISNGRINLRAHSYLRSTSQDRISGVEDIDATGNTTPTSETIIGNARDNLVDGGAGEDVIRTGAGNDAIHVRSASTTTGGVSERGRFWGGRGEDSITFLDQADVDLGDGTAAFGNRGHLTLRSIEDVRSMIGGRLVGNGGPNILVGGFRSDDLSGRGGRDTLLGRLDDDQLDGGPGRDRLDGGAGTDACRNGERVSNCE
jgi:Ca2+-binding RTX toxin-like protein